MKHGKKYIILTILLLCIASVIIFSSNKSIARYVSNSFWNYFVKSKDFYFTSNSLSEVVTKNVDNLWTGESVKFIVRNGVNDKVVSNTNIEYSATCNVVGEAESYAACKMNGTNTDTFADTLTSSQVCSNTTGDGKNVSSYNEETCLAEGYDYVYIPVEKELYFDIVLTDNTKEIKDVVVNVLVASTTPYKKELKGVFTLHKSELNDDEIIMNYKNYSDYGKLTITSSYSVNKCMELSWNSDNLSINSNSNILSKSYDLNGYINKVVFLMNPKSNMSYIFNSRDLETIYNSDSFTISESSACQ